MLRSALGLIEPCILHPQLMRAIISLFEPRLKLGGFTIIRKVPVTPWRVDLVATQKSGNVLTYKLLRVILATVMDRVDEQTIRNCSQIMTKYAQAYFVE